MKNQSKINFLPIGLSLIFLFNPNIAVIDLFPDFLGYIFLSLAIVKLADINESVAEAASIFNKMILVDAAKLFAIVWIFWISPPSEENSAVLLWSFIFGVLEMVFIIPAFIKLYKGFAELGYFHDNYSILGARNRKNSKISRRNYTEKIRSFTIFFIVVKATLSFLPELITISFSEYLESHGNGILYILRMFSFIPVFIVGLIWIIKIIVYFGRITKDTKLINSLSAAYREKVLPQKGIFIKRNVKISFVILLVAVVLSFDFRVQNINIFPDVLSALLLLVFFLFIRRKTKVNLIVPIILSVFGVISGLVSMIFEIRFFEEYTWDSIYRTVPAMNAYTLMCITSITNCLVFAAIFVFVLRALNSTVTEHTGIIASNSSVNEAARKSINKSIHAELRRTLIIDACVMLVYTATDILYVLLAKNFGAMMLINVIGAAAFFAMLIKTYFDLYEAVISRYALE